MLVVDESRLSGTFEVAKECRGCEEGDQPKRMSGEKGDFLGDRGKIERI